MSPNDSVVGTSTSSSISSTAGAAVAVAVSSSFTQNSNNPIDIMGGGAKSSSSSIGMGIFQNESSFKLLLLMLMVIQNSSVVLVGRYSRSSVAKDDLYVVNHFILITELGKFLVSCILEFYATGGNLTSSIQENILDAPMTDSLKILVPALLYLVQNSLLYVALSNLSAPLFQVTYQAKLLTTALVSVALLKRQYSAKQWICLTTLGLGVAFVVLGEKAKSTSTTSTTTAASTIVPAGNLVVGLVSVTISCLSSALAGVYFELVVKKSTTDETTGRVKPPVSLWMRNMQLAFFSVVIAIAQNLFSPKDTTIDTNNDASSITRGFFHGFTGWVWLLVALQAGGGLLVAAVIKYADNVLKGLATGVSVVTSTLLSIVLFGTPLTIRFAMGAAVILSSVYLFSNNVPSIFLMNMGGNKKERDASAGGAATVDRMELSSKPLILPK